MNKEEIVEMPAGSKLDALISCNVMKIPHAWISGKIVPNGDEKRYSTDVAAAWEVLEELNEVKDPKNNDGDYGIWVKVWERLSDINMIAMTGEEASLEICRAALLALYER